MTTYVTVTWRVHVCTRAYVTRFTHAVCRLVRSLATCQSVTSRAPPLRGMRLSDSSDEWQAHRLYNCCLRRFAPVINARAFNTYIRYGVPIRIMTTRTDWDNVYYSCVRLSTIACTVIVISYNMSMCADSSPKTNTAGDPEIAIYERINNISLESTRCSIHRWKSSKALTTQHTCINAIQRIRLFHAGVVSHKWRHTCTAIGNTGRSHVVKIALLNGHASGHKLVINCDFTCILI